MLDTCNTNKLKNSKLEKILIELRQALNLKYGHRLAKIVLFGSQARNEAVHGIAKVLLNEVV